MHNQRKASAQRHEAGIQGQANFQLRRCAADHQLRRAQVEGGWPAVRTAFWGDQAELPV